MRAGRKLALWAPVAVYAAVLYHFSGRVPPPPLFSAVWDKALHAGAYAGLAFLLIRALHGGLGRFRPGLALAGAVGAVLYGASEEVRQSFIPGRFASGADLLADAIGTGFAVAAAALLARFAASRKARSAPRD